MPNSFAAVPFRAQTIQLEYEWVNREITGAPLVVFLHEGLGSIAAWRGFPQTLCNVAGFRGLIYSRYGYGQSSRRPDGRKWPLEYLQDEAREVLPGLLRALDLELEKVWVFGHSDGASIALIYAATFPNALAGAIVCAPHIFVEQESVRGVQLLKSAYESGELRPRLARYHADVDSVFRGWSGAWLDPEFRSWNIESLLPAIRCPVLAVQGLQDEYGTMKHLDDLKRLVSQTELLKLQSCGHAPHRDRPEAVSAAAIAFIRG